MFSFQLSNDLEALGTLVRVHVCVRMYVEGVRSRKTVVIFKLGRWVTFMQWFMEHARTYDDGQSTRKLCFAQSGRQQADRRQFELLYVHLEYTRGHQQPHDMQFMIFG